ncbi:NAD(P)H-hydrate epimerase-like isoform X2 [Pollicipes pollicipes]|nr:NAD(P)H-hydrate epimerase-like isoform X2 [Pollicipes pollicipes]XP_037080743.1 NAD(P)H-hydrate epimerase-like isoform X2 [Pollicipes pollicipes]
MPPPLRHLTQREATEVDRELFSEYQFSVDQLMELAGLSCAVAVATHYPPAGEAPAVLVVCGPGNNGGDGLVCARHLSLFGFAPTVYYPVQKEVALYQRLAHQCRQAGVPVLEQPPADVTPFRLVVDALFGFSFRPPVRPVLEPAMRLLTDSPAPVCSLDVPSGWHVEEGPGEAPALEPALLVSLTAPKLCARFFSGAHYLGGRFVPPALEKKYDLNLPEYPGTSCVVRL